MIRGEQRPADLVRSNRVIGSTGLLWTVVTRFWIQITLGVTGAVAFAIAGAALVTGEATQKSTVALILGGFGVTAASLYARAKAVANSLVDEIRQTFEEDRVGMVAIIRPPRPFKALATGAEVKLHSERQDWTTDVAVAALSARWHLDGRSPDLAEKMPA